MGICFGKCCGQTVTGNVVGCNSTAQPNVSVSITVGSNTYGPTTTDASGNWSLAGIATGSATITYTPPATNYQNRYAVGTQSVTIGSGTNHENFTLVPATGYFCCFGWNIPVANTLNWTDSQGTHSIAGGTSCPWGGCYMGNPGQQVWDSRTSALCGGASRTTENVAFRMGVTTSVAGGVTTASATIGLYSGNDDFSGGCSASIGTNLVYGDCSGFITCHNGCSVDAGATGSVSVDPNSPPNFSVTMPAVLTESVTGKTYTNPIAGTVMVSE